jgi:hypothetical protein
MSTFNSLPLQVLTTDREPPLRPFHSHLYCLWRIVSRYLLWIFFPHTLAAYGESSATSPSCFALAGWLMMDREWYLSIPFPFLRQVLTADRE